MEVKNMGAHGQVGKEPDWGSMQGSVALFGGTFDPVQSAHIEVAERALSHVDRVVFVPARVNPHKVLGPQASYDERLEMLELAIAHQKRFSCSRFELNRAGPSYTVDTVRHIRLELPKVTKLFLLLGGDSMRTFPTWRQPEAIIELLDGLLVAPRGAKESDSVAAILQTFPPAIAGKLRVHVLAGAPIDISATAVRERLAKGQSIAGLVPTEVESYLSEKKLYRLG